MILINNYTRGTVRSNELPGDLITEYVFFPR